MFGGAAKTVVEERLDGDFFLVGVQCGGAGGFAEKVHPGLAAAADGRVRPRALHPTAVDRPPEIFCADRVDALMGFNAIGTDHHGLLCPVVIKKFTLEGQRHAIEPVVLGLFNQVAPRIIKCSKGLAGSAGDVGVDMVAFLENQAAQTIEHTACLDVFGVEADVFGLLPVTGTEYVLVFAACFEVGFRGDHFAQ
ncbi:hypothetical protein D3C87_1107000 [compost metagenome]